MAVSDAADAPEHSALDTALDASDPIAREAQTFSRLSAETIERVTRYGSEERFAARAPVFSRGDRSVDFFVVLQGSIEIFEVDEHDPPQIFVVLRQRQFAGELDLFNERQVLVSARAGEPSRLLRVKPVDFRRLVSTEAAIGEIVMRAFILRRVGLIRHVHGGVIVVGPAHDADTLRLQQFLSGNAYPHRLLDTEGDADAAGFLDCFSLTSANLPVVIAPGHRLRKNPSLAQMADDLGMTETFDHATVFDLAVVGAGAGRSRRRGVRCIGRPADDRPRKPGAWRPGRNELEDRELPRLSDRHLRAGARRPRPGPGAEVRRPPRAPARCDRPVLRNGALHAQARRRPIDPRPRRRRRDGRALPQARRRRLRALRGPRHLLRGDGDGADLCADEKIVGGGGGNSAGQAAVFLAGTARHVHMLVRGAGLAATMSVQRIERAEKISLYPHSEVTALAGDASLRSVTWADRRSGEPTTRPARSIFVMIGAEPNTQWAADCLALDVQGFVCTGTRAGADADSPYVTSRAGVYAVGDVRSGSVKRVASGVGEGSVVVQAIHRFLNPPTA